MAATWKSAIQLTDPPGSMLSLEALLADTEARFLAHDRPSEAPPVHTQFHEQDRDRGRSARFHSARRGKATRFLKRNFSIVGQVEDHPFSLTIANGLPLVAAEVFSLVGADQKAKEKDVRATAWAFEDVKKRHKERSLAALMIRGQEPTLAFEDAKKVFDSLGVVVVPKEDVNGWADTVAQRVLRSTGA